MSIKTKNKNEIFFVTFDKDKKTCGRSSLTYILSRGIHPKGFEKQENGNFHKYLGDPRCITDKERAKKIKEAVKAAEQKAKWGKENLARRVNVEVGQKTDFALQHQNHLGSETGQHVQISGPIKARRRGSTNIKYDNMQLIRASKQMQWCDFLVGIHQFSHNIDPKIKRHIFIKATFLRDMIFGENLIFKIDQTIPKIEVFPYQNVIRFWLTDDKQKQADYMVTNIFEFNQDIK